MIKQQAPEEVFVFVPELSSIYILGAWIASINFVP